MTADDTVSCAIKVYKQLNMIAASRDQAFAILQIVNTLLNMDALHDPKTVRETN